MIQYTPEEDVLPKRTFHGVFIFLTIFAVLLMVCSLPYLNESDEDDVPIRISINKLIESSRRRIIEQISLINKQEKIQNEETFGTSSDYSVVIVIQVSYFVIKIPFCLLLQNKAKQF